MTDIETIQLQILKLGLLKSDDKIQEIIETLYETNYAQAQSLIIEYIETPHHEILQRTFQKEKEKFQKEKRTHERFQDKAVHEKEAPAAIPKEKTEEERIAERDLFDIPTENVAGPTIIDLDDMINIHNKHREKIQKKENNISFDSLLNIKSDDVMPDNVKIDLETSKSKEDFWELNEDEIEENPIEKDTFFDAEIPEIMTRKESPHSQEEKKAEEKPEETEDITLAHTEETGEEDMHKEEVQEETNDKETIEEDAAPEKSEENSIDVNYQAITYIDQKFKNMQVQYPINEESDESFDSVDQWLIQISTEGYSESEVEAMIKKIDTLRVEHKSEAAQLLLVTAATQSKYAQFRLARALYTGDILQKNLAEAFTLINRLAVNEDYPEAICDLAQFYEYGIGIGKDKKQAELLYSEALELGIQRAEAHVRRLKKENKGFFSFGKK